MNKNIVLALTMLVSSIAWADSNIATAGTPPGSAKSFYKQLYRINNTGTTSIVSLPGTNAHTGGDPTVSIRQALATLQVQGNANTVFGYDGTTTATTCQTTYTVIKYQNTCPQVFVRGVGWTDNCGQHSSLVNCSGTPNGPWLITLINRGPGTSWVTWNRGGDTLGGVDADGNAYSDNLNKAEISQAVLREVLHAMGINSSDTTCLSGAATGQALNKVFYTSRNALCEDEISAIGTGYGSRFNPSCMEQVSTSKYFNNYLYREISTNFAPSGTSFGTAAGVYEGAVRTTSGLGGYDAVRGVSALGAVQGLYQKTVIEAVGHTTKVKDYRNITSLTGGPLDSFRRPSVTFDPIHRIWYAFGHIRGGNTRNVNYYTSANGTTWSYRGLVRATKPFVPCGVSGCMSSVTCNSLNSWQTPIETRHPVSAAYSPFLQRIVVAYLDYEQTQGPVGEAGSGYAGGPSGSIGIATMDVNSDLNENRWNSITSGAISTGMGIATSMPPVVSCSTGDIGDQDFGSCSFAYSSPLNHREVRTHDFGFYESTFGNPNGCKWMMFLNASVYGGYPASGNNGASFYPAAFVRSSIGIDYQALVVLGTDGNLYAEGRTAPGGVPNSWPGFTGIPTPTFDGSSIIELQFPVFTGNTTNEGFLELLFTGKRTDDDVCTYSPMYP